MYEYITNYRNCLFVTPKIKFPARIGNCCFPEFLTPEYRRICGTAFEGLNRTTNIGIPTGQPMIGIGISAKDARNQLTEPINLRIGGILVTLTTL
jgi:hypothetical protein